MAIVDKAVEHKSIALSTTIVKEADFESLCKKAILYADVPVHIGFDSQVANSGSFLLRANTPFEFPVQFTRVSAIQDNTWTTQYEANELPDAATPAWTLYDDLPSWSTLEISPAGYLREASATVAGQSQTQIYDISASPSKTPGVTMEVRLKVVNSMTNDAPNWNNSYYGFGIQFGALDLDSAYLYIYEDGIRCEVGSSQSYEMDTTDDYHTYRITVYGTSVKVYVDGILRIMATGTEATTHIFDFSTGFTFGGEWIMGDDTTQEVSWDYVYYRTDGAYAPSGTLYINAKR